MSGDTSEIFSRCRKCKKERQLGERWFFRCDDCNKCDLCNTKDDLCHYVRGVFCGPCHEIHSAEKIKEFEEKGIDTDYTDEITCPYCGCEFSDSWELGDEGEYDCGECNKSFIYSRDVSVSYSTSKI